MKYFPILKYIIRIERYEVLGYTLPPHVSLYNKIDVYYMLFFNIQKNITNIKRMQYMACILYFSSIIKTSTPSMLLYTLLQAVA